MAFGPVLLVAPDDVTASGVLANCESHDLCAAINDGRVRLAVVPHDTPWIRDYGPFVEPAIDGAPRVVDASYDDEREDATINEALRKITSERENKLMHLRRVLDGSDLTTRLETLLGGGVPASGDREDGGAAARNRLPADQAPTSFARRYAAGECLTMGRRLDSPER
jgi:hypothetical protein